MTQKDLDSIRPYLEDFILFMDNQSGINIAAEVENFHQRRIEDEKQLIEESAQVEA